MYQGWCYELGPAPVLAFETKQKPNPDFRPPQWGEAQWRSVVKELFCIPVGRRAEIATWQCWHFARNGDCVYADACRFGHFVSTPEQWQAVVAEMHERRRKWIWTPPPAAICVSSPRPSRDEPQTEATPTPAPTPAPPPPPPDPLRRLKPNELQRFRDKIERLMKHPYDETGRVVRRRDRKGKNIRAWDDAIAFLTRYGFEKQEDGCLVLKLQPEQSGCRETALHRAYEKERKTLEKALEALDEALARC